MRICLLLLALKGSTLFIPVKSEVYAHKSEDKRLMATLQVEEDFTANNLIEKTR